MFKKISCLLICYLLIETLILPARTWAINQGVRKCPNIGKDMLAPALIIKRDILEAIFKEDLVSSLIVRINDLEKEPDYAAKIKKYEKFYWELLAIKEINLDYKLKNSSPELSRDKQLVDNFLKGIDLLMRQGYFNRMMLKPANWVVVKDKLYYCGYRGNLIPGEGALKRLADELILRLKSYGFKDEYFREEILALLNGRQRKTVGMLEDEITYANLYAHHRQSLAKMVGANKRVLSVGCGINGKLEKLLREQGCYVMGMDIRIKAAQNPGLDRFILGDMRYIHNLPLMQEEKFDVIVFSESIGYMNEMDTLKKAYDFLTPKGKVIITTFPPGKGSKKKISNYKRYTVEKWKALLKRLDELFQVEYVNEIFLMAYDHMFTLPGHVIRIGLEKKQAMKLDQMIQEAFNEQNCLALEQAI